MRKSIDPVKAYKAKLEMGIYAMLLDLIAKELEAEQAATTPAATTLEATAPEATAAEKTTIAEPVAQIGAKAV